MPKIFRTHQAFCHLTAILRVPLLLRLPFIKRLIPNNWTPQRMQKKFTLSGSQTLLKRCQCKLYICRPLHLLYGGSRYPMHNYLQAPKSIPRISGRLPLLQLSRNGFTKIFPDPVNSFLLTFRIQKRGIFRHLLSELATDAELMSNY